MKLNHLCLLFVCFLLVLEGDSGFRVTFSITKLLTLGQGLMVLTHILWSYGALLLAVMVARQLFWWTGGGRSSRRGTCTHGRLSKQKDRKGSISTDRVCEVVWSGALFTPEEITPLELQILIYIFYSRISDSYDNHILPVHVDLTLMDSTFGHRRHTCDSHCLTPLQSFVAPLDFN